MENLIYFLMCLLFGILFIWYSRHEKSYAKTAEVQGEKIAKKKFKIIKLCGYLLIVGACAFGLFIILEM
jgi:uncharacterized membrane protein